LKLKLQVAVAILFAPGLPLSYAQAARGAMIKEANIYLSSDPTSTKVGEIKRGREVIIIETIRDWLNVQANVTDEKTIGGWVQDKGVIQKTTQDGDRILFGEGVDSEDEASRSHGRRGAAQDAMYLYYRVADYFPASPLAAEALYRAADIRWQVDKADVMTRPSAKEQDPHLRPLIDDDLMKQVIKKYPGTKWADLAAFHLIDNKVCGDWQGQSKCPEKESEIYEKYAAEHPQYNTAAEALYDAAVRQAALIEIYKTEEQPKKSDQAKARAQELTQRLVTKYPQSDWAPRADRLAYYVQQGIPTYGNQ
jgi:outer membrane protein assembly factor BamD (BamD/ComL family)